MGGREAPYPGGRTPFLRHLRNRSDRPREWPAADAPITEDDITAEQVKEGPTLELSLRNKFVTLPQLSAIVKKIRVKMKSNIEYYACLVLLRDAVGTPAMRAFMDGKKFTTMRAAFLHILREWGIESTGEDAV